MNYQRLVRLEFAVALAALLSPCGFGRPARADSLIVNGGFEFGFTGWTRADQIGSEGTFQTQSGSTSPVNNDPVPPPPHGTSAMTDATGPGTHVLYQDFAVPTTPGLPEALRFSLFIGNRAGVFFTPSPASLDFSTPSLNQQVRVDIMAAGTDPFSVASSDVLLNVYQSKPGDPSISGYSTISMDVSSLLAAHAGQTLRLRFAEVDNVFSLQMGIDDVSLGTVPEPSSIALLAISGLALAAVARRPVKTRA